MVDEKSAWHACFHMSRRMLQGWSRLCRSHPWLPSRSPAEGNSVTLIEPRLVLIPRKSNSEVISLDPKIFLTSAALRGGAGDHSEEQWSGRESVDCGGGGLKR